MKKQFYTKVEISRVLSDKGIIEDSDHFAHILSKSDYTFKKLHKLYMALKIIKSGKTW